MDTYKRALEQAKADLANRIAELGAAQKLAELAEKEIVGLRQTVSALQRLCGESEYVEEDALGLTDAIRMTFKTAAGGSPLTAQDVKELMENSGYAGRWGNLLASIHTVIKRLHAKGEIEPGANINGRDTFRWAGYTGVADRPGKRIARKPSAGPSKDPTLGAILSSFGQGTISDGSGEALARFATGATLNTVPGGPNKGTFLEGFGESLSSAASSVPVGTVPSGPNQVPESSQEVTKLLESIAQPPKGAR